MTRKRTQLIVAATMTVVAALAGFSRWGMAGPVALGRGAPSPVMMLGVYDPGWLVHPGKSFRLSPTGGAVVLPGWGWRAAQPILRWSTGDDVDQEFAVSVKNAWAAARRIAYGEASPVGLAVVAIREGGGGWRAGLRVGDVITRVGKTRDGWEARVVEPCGGPIPIRVPSQPGTSLRNALGVALKPVALFDGPAVPVLPGARGGSAGLPYALAFLEEWGTVDLGGHRVAATGAVTPDGRVEPVTGLDVKLLAARAAGADVVFVPAGSDWSWDDPSMTVVPVRTVREAVDWLAEHS